MRTDVEQLFHEVADLTEEARVRYFAEREIDTRTRKEVEALLAFDSITNTFLDRNIVQVAHRALEHFEVNGLQCGPYQLRDLLGRGGMGAVYSADRVDGEVAQRVAVKLLRAGAQDPLLRERFLTERQILATLSHPNIARLLDAGHREDGQPFLVMEHIEGKPIDMYLAGFSVEEKIGLFLKVCAAVSYLHRNLVVHRDLKPANILVAADGEPKLLDFGIAKMLDLTADSTATTMRVLTPDYASPEQVAGAPITTATDIYSLGAVLYQLLTGTAPHRFEGDSPAGIALAISSGKITPPSKLDSALKGDIEVVLMKALRKEPTERYASVDALADDLRAILEWRPVQARSGDVSYRTRKFLRRHWVSATATALVIASLTAGLYIANRERAIAERRFVDVRQLADKLFDIDERVARLPGGTEIRRFIVDTSLEYLRRVTADVRMDPALALEVGTAYMRVARVQTVDLLGQTDRADETAQKAEALLESVLAAEPQNRIALLRSAEIAQDRMLIAREHRKDGMLFAQRSALRLQQYLTAARKSGKLDRAEAEDAILVHLNVANEFVRAQQLDESIRISRRAIDLARETNWPAYAGGALMNVALVYRAQGDLDEALKAISESVQMLRPAPGEKSAGKSFAYVYALTNQGRILGEDNEISLGRPREAVESLQRAAEVAGDLARRDPNEFRSREAVFGADLIMSGILRHTDPRRALDLCDDALRRLSEIRDHGGARLHEVEALAMSTYPLQRLGRAAEAHGRLDLAFERLRELHAYPAEKIKPGTEADEALSARADWEAENGNIPKAIETYRELLRKVLASEAKPETSLTDAVQVSRVYAALAALYGRAGQTAAESGMQARRVELWREWNASLPNNNFIRRQLDGGNKRVL